MTLSQTAQNAQSIYDFWMRLIPNAPGGWAATLWTGGPAAQFPLQALNQSWTDLANQFTGRTPGQFDIAFDRIYGGVSDALGFGPARRLQSASQEIIAAGVAQQEARANYLALVQAAIAGGMQRLTARLAEMADKRERIDSVVTLLRLWAVCAEEVLHETLQSEAGLAATAALTRSAMIYRKRVQHAAPIVTDVLDIGTRHELDEAYRDIQMLKRELRELRQGAVPDPEPSTPAKAQRPRTTGKLDGKPRIGRKPK